MSVLQKHKNQGKTKIVPELQDSSFILRKRVRDDDACGKRDLESSKPKMSFASFLIFRVGASDRLYKVIELYGEWLKLCKEGQTIERDL